MFGWNTEKAKASVLAGLVALSLVGCGASPSEVIERASRVAESASATTSEQASVTDEQTNATAKSADSSAMVTAVNASSDGAMNTEDLFTDRDLTQEADLAEATSITVKSGEDVSITKEGTYVVTGTANNVTITVDVDSSEKVQLVLDGLSITNDDSAAIYVASADKVFVTTVEGTTNTLCVTGTFAVDGSTNVDAVIFSKDDLVLNGLGTLNIESTDNGVSCKDDLKITGGTYVIECQADALEANENVLVADGNFSITSNKDAIHAEYDEDNTVGNVYIAGGTFDIAAASDGIQATCVAQIDGGSLQINAAEGIEGTYVQINDGSVNISASDDGVNATNKSTISTPTIEIRGGVVDITMAAGDTDALDSNGNLYISGGTVTISAQYAFDFDGEAELSGGTVTVNGEQVTTIQNSMMGGGMGGGMGGPGAGGMGVRVDDMGAGMGGFRGDMSDMSDSVSG
ncbi:MAG: carbohydrate-binding domain-containing protein [Coriobacteriales bacterium]|nr:carbohydrate-binding domain-containing protein [Coriobacteriales bacterium]